MSVDRSLRSFLSDELGEPVRRVRREVSAVHELSAVVKSLEHRGNPVVLFERVAGSVLPVIVGVTGSRQRVARALGRPVAECVEHVLDAIERPLPTRPVDAAPVQQVVLTGADATADALPIGVHSPADAGRYITAGVLLVRDPAGGAINGGIYRTMVKDPRTLTVNVAPQHDLAAILRAAGDNGAPVECAIVIGGHPTLTIASQAKNARTVDTLGLAGALQGGPLATVSGTTIDIDVPAQAEIVIEGRLRPDRLEAEGPFGEFTYYYGASRGWICEITAITHRDDALYVDLHPAHVEHRCLWLFPGREARLLSLLRSGVPGVRAVTLPFHGAGLSAYIALGSHHDGDAQRALLLALSSDTYIKHAIAVDDDIDIFDEEQVLWALNTRFQADRDLLVIPRCRGVRMDPSGYDFLDRGAVGTLVTKAGFDATMPVARPYGPRADVPPPGFESLDASDYLSAADAADLLA